MRIERHPRDAVVETAMTIGSFDGVHLGHRAILEHVMRKAQARRLQSAVLTFEPLPREFFSPAQAPPRLMSMAERLDALARAGVQQVFLQRFDRAFASIAAEQFERDLRGRYGARWLMVGEDFRYGTRRMGDLQSLRAAGERHGYEVVPISAVMAGGERISSTRVREALREGNLAEAARLLGRPYSICGRVVQGAKRGRALGFPTANVRLARPKPALAGIFAVKCFVDAETRGLEGVASLGINPAVKQDGQATLEAFLFDFSGDLYGRRLTVEFRKKLRDEAHFASLEALAAQIQRDCDAAREYFRAL